MRTGEQWWREAVEDHHGSGTFQSSKGLQDHSENENILEKSVPFCNNLKGEMYILYTQIVCGSTYLKLFFFFFAD